MNFMDAALWNKRAIGEPFASPRRLRKFNQIYGRLLMGPGEFNGRSPYPGPAAALALDHLVALFQQALALAILAFLLLLDVGAFCIGHDDLQTMMPREPIDVSPEADVPGRRDTIAVNSMRQLGACRHSPAHGGMAR
jgi:hypothetical protein